MKRVWSRIERGKVSVADDRGHLVVRTDAIGAFGGALAGGRTSDELRRIAGDYELFAEQRRR